MLLLNAGNEQTALTSASLACLNAPFRCPEAKRPSAMTGGAAGEDYDL